MERNKEIATSANLADSLTEQQCDVLEWGNKMNATKEITPVLNAFFSMP